MRRLFCSLLIFLGKLVFSLRYKVKVTGKEFLKKKNFNDKSGILFLPNHPALVDPIFISMLVWRKFNVRPLVVEYVYRQPGINFILKMIRALSVPNLDTSMNEVKIKKAQKVVEEIIDGLKKRENFILYPGGRLKHTGKEIMGGSSATASIFQSCPDVNVVLVRTTGLWGSSFSRAYTGRSPDFKSTVLRGLKKLVKNFIFFMPRRKVLIEIEPLRDDFIKSASRLEVNRYLENWYNRYPVEGKRVGIEPLNKVSYSCFKKDFYEIPESEKKGRISIKEKEFSSETEKKVFMELSRFQPDVEIEKNMSLTADLGMDSLDIAELIAFLSVQFDIGEVHPEDIEMVQDVLEMAEGKKKTGKKISETASTYTWPEEKNRPEVTPPLGKTIIESFLLKCDKLKNYSACGDDLMGVLSYKKMKLAVLALSLEIKKMKGDTVGVFLPASSGAYMVILAVMLAGKTPVMLNWTLGPRFLNHMVAVTKTQNVICSWKFLEKLSNVDFGSLTEKLCLLEDIKKNMTKKEKLKAFFLSTKRAKGILKSFSLNKMTGEEKAVILFTSGTEAAPKGVVLSHKNIISNLTIAMQSVKFKSSDIFYGFLPPFHSFGFSASGVFSLMVGMKIAFSPDPTDSYSLAEGIARWKATVICAAPSFLKGILQVATKKQLETMRFFVVGAEKVPQDLYNKVEALGKGKQLIEGYGITECSPIVSIVGEGNAPVGVGTLVSIMEFCTINPETLEKLPSPKMEGEICLRGPNVFKGYLGGEKDPFITLDGKKWYCSGDLGYMDDEGHVILSGRLKRFTKIGGEMISLGGIEELILKGLDMKNVDLGEGAHLALCAKEREAGKTELVLFSTYDFEKFDINDILKQAGCSRLVKVSQIKKIDEIPLMGSGKVDYRFLQTMLG